jgi:hypothetical protein
MASDECTCKFKLRSYGYSCINSEKYTLPCKEAIEFMRQLQSERIQMICHSKSHFHEISNYELLNKDNKYRQYHPDSPLKAAAKIELFMKNPEFMPK